MAQEIINDGDSGLEARSKINDNFSELYQADTDASAALQAALADYATLVYVGATFAPIVHTHSIAAVSGLQTALDSKAAFADLTAPLSVDSGETFIVRENQQMAFRFPIQVDGTIQIDGVLYEV